MDMVLTDFDPPQYRLTPEDIRLGVFVHYRGCEKEGRIRKERAWSCVAVISCIEERHRVFRVRPFDTIVEARRWHHFSEKNDVFQSERQAMRLASAGEAVQALTKHLAEFLENPWKEHPESYARRLALFRKHLQLAELAAKK